MRPSEELLARTVAFYIASPSNPQGAVADEAYLTRLANHGAPFRLSWSFADAPVRAPN